MKKKLVQQRLLAKLTAEFLFAQAVSAERATPLADALVARCVRVARAKVLRLGPANKTLLCKKCSALHRGANKFRLEEQGDFVVVECLVCACRRKMRKEKYAEYTQTNDFVLAS